MDLETMRQDSNYHVEVKCNKCGRETGFFPHRVVYLHPCDCGNNNFGIAHKDWQNGIFGDFTVIEESILTFQIPYWRDIK